MEAKQKIHWKLVGLYYFLACAISWPFFWWRDIHRESFIALPIPGIVKSWSIMWGPGIAAFVILFLFRKTHVRTITFFGTHTLRSILFYCVPILLLAIAGIETKSGVLHLYVLGMGGIGFITILGEELGWRGFLQDALRPLSPWKRYILIGILWEFWHFTNRTSHGSLLSVFTVLAVSYPVVIFLSWLIGEQTDRGRSIIIAVTLHSWVNITAEFASFRTVIVLLIAIPFWVYLLKTWPHSPKEDLIVPNSLESKDTFAK